MKSFNGFLAGEAIGKFIITFCADFKGGNSLARLFPLWSRLVFVSIGLCIGIFFNTLAV